MEEGRQPHARPAEAAKVGLIGGLAYRAGLFYYEQLLDDLKRRGQANS